MNHELVFTIANNIALFSWVLLIFFPAQKVSRFIVHNGIAAVLLSLLYLVFAVIGIVSGAPGGFSSLASVEQLLSSKDWLLAGWIHYLAFDLLIGSWIVSDAINRKLNRFVVAPFLVATFMLGPIGFLAYWIFRKNKFKTILWENESRQ